MDGLQSMEVLVTTSCLQMMQDRAVPADGGKLLDVQTHSLGSVLVPQMVEQLLHLVPQMEQLLLAMHLVSSCDVPAPKIVAASLQPLVKVSNEVRIPTLVQCLPFFCAFAHGRFAFALDCQSSASRARGIVASHAMGGASAQALCDEWVLITGWWLYIWNREVTRPKCFQVSHFRGCRWRCLLLERLGQAAALWTLADQTRLCRLRTKPKCSIERMSPNVANRIRKSLGRDLSG